MLPGEQLVVHTAGAGGWGLSGGQGGDVSAPRAITVAKASGSLGMFSAAQNECD